MTLPKPYNKENGIKKGKSMEFYSRKSPRMEHFDYSSENYYFITICTRNKKCLFGLPEEQRALGLLAQRHIEEIEKHYANIHVEKYVVMPNHVHMILVVEKGQQISIEYVIGLYKSGVTREIRKNHPGFVLWQRSFHDHVIRTQSAYEKIWQYIENNPQKWEEDCFYSKE